MDTINEIDLTAAIKNCKILIAIVSDQFEREAKCRDILIYAKETLNKEIIVIVSGESMDWQTKDMGMKIGAQEVRPGSCQWHQSFVTTAPPPPRPVGKSQPQTCGKSQGLE